MEVKTSEALVESDFGTPFTYAGTLGEVDDAP